jgi:peptide/nickel transport system substrate-binding protein
MTDRDGDGMREGPQGPMQFTIFANGSKPAEVRAAQLVAEDLSEVGLATTMRALDAGSMSDLTTSRDFDMFVNITSPHAVADPTQFIMSHRSGNLWRAPDLPYPEWDSLFAQWKATTTNEDRLAVLGEMQALFNRQPTSVPLLYPEEYWAYRSDRFADWVESPGYGIVHKWSLLPPQVGRDAQAVVTPR